MPAGLSHSAFYGWLIGQLGEAGAKAWWKWFSEAFPAWGAEGWTRLDAARAAGCEPPAAPSG